MTSNFGQHNTIGNIAFAYHHMQTMRLEFVQPCGQHSRVNSWTGSDEEQKTTLTVSLTVSLSSVKAWDISTFFGQV